jgi:hypothetical protein
MLSLIIFIADTLAQIRADDGGNGKWSVLKLPYVSLLLYNTVAKQQQNSAKQNNH